MQPTAPASPAPAQAPAPAPTKPSFFNKLKHPSQFSKPQLAIFILVFAAVGYLLIKAFAAAPLITSLQAEQMTPSGGTTASSGFMTNLTNNGSLTAPYMWTFSPGVDTSAGYFYADGKQLAKITGPGPYAFRLNPGTLTSGAHKLGGSWDTATGVHQTFPAAYSENITNSSANGFVTTVTNNMTINAPYIWAFDPGTATSAGYFFADGKQLAKITGPGPYVLMLGGGDNNLLSSGAHKLGHAWDTTTGVHQTPASAYAVTYNPATSTSVNSSVISDSSASGGQAVKFGGGVSLSGNINLSSQAASLTVMAHGEQCSGAWPQMNVKVDGLSVLTTTVSATSWTAYNINLTLSSGSHAISITNASSGSCIPNLYADVTNFYGPNVTSNPPTVSISSSPSNISSGQSSTLTWSSTNATACSASGAWSGSKPTSGSASTGALSQNSTYTLICTGSGGSATASATVTVSTSTNTTSYDSAIAYTQTRPAFTPTRTINVSSAAQFNSALSNLQAGDLVKATAGFTVSGETIISKRLSSPAVIDLSAYPVHFVYSGGSNISAVWMRNSQNIRLYGGDLSTSDTGGTCMTWYASQHVTWWGLTVHDCGGAGIGVANAKPGYSFAGPVSYDDIQAEIWKMGQHPAWDDHLELCTGIHGANLSDANTDSFDHNRFAFYVHDTNCIGGGIEFGTGQPSPLPTTNTIYLKCVNFSFISTIQTGGNCFQSWGYGVLNTDIKYLEADNITGHPYLASGLYHKPNSYLSTDVLEYGRSINVRQNSRYASDPNWDKTGGTSFKNVSPLP